MADKIYLFQEQRSVLARIRSEKIGKNIRRGYFEAQNFPSPAIYPSRHSLKRVIPKPTTLPPEKHDVDELASFAQKTIREREEYLEKTLDYLLEGAAKGNDDKRIICEQLIKMISGEVSLEFRNRYTERYNSMLDSYDRVCQLRRDLVEVPERQSNLAARLGEAIESGKDKLRDFGSITHKILLNFTQQTGQTEQTGQA